MSNLYLHVLELNRREPTFSKVLTIAYEVSLFSLFISVIISWADLFSCFCTSSPIISSSYSGRIFSTRNFFSSWGFFFTFYFSPITSVIRLARSLLKTSCSLLVSANRF